MDHRETIWQEWAHMGKGARDVEVIAYAMGIDNVLRFLAAHARQCAVKYGPGNQSGYERAAAALDALSAQLTGL